MKVLVIQTAFAGDLILTLPLIQELKERSHDAEIHVLCIPSTVSLLDNHPDIGVAHVYDKRAKEPGMLTLSRTLRNERFDLCLSPHRSLRSAILAFASRARDRISFDNSSGRFLYTELVPYQKGSHEIHRNVALLEPLGWKPGNPSPPRLYPGEKEKHSVDKFLRDNGCTHPFICIAPGSVWATKRWTPEGFVESIKSFAKNYAVVLVGGQEDEALCESIRGQVPAGNCFSAAGMLRFLESAELIRRSALLISNDSAPVHIASAVGTPVVEIFGATAPEFGFTAYGVSHEIVQVEGLTCKPCRIHGGHSCPVRTFDCMKKLEPSRVIEAARRVLNKTL